MSGQDIPEERIQEWKKCFSRTRKKNYFFNARLNESLWTLDEVKQRIRQELAAKLKPPVAPDTDTNPASSSKS